MRRVAVLSMPRSGHTAIMRWLSKQYTPAADVADIHTGTYDELASRVRGAFRVLVIRDYPNWMASVTAKYSHDFSVLDDWADMWITHARVAWTVPTILYDEWAARGCGIGVKGADSSFDGGSVLDRCEQSVSDPRWRRMMLRGDAVEASAALFGKCPVASEVAA